MTGKISGKASAVLPPKVEVKREDAVRAVASIVERGLWRDDDPVIIAITHGSVRASSAASGIRDWVHGKEPDGALASAFKSAIARKDTEVLKLLRPQLDETTQWVAEGVIEGIRAQQ